jgi:hypothetical protein
MHAVRNVEGRSRGKVDENLRVGETRASKWIRLALGRHLISGADTFGKRVEGMVPADATIAVGLGFARGSGWLLG